MIKDNNRQEQEIEKEKVCLIGDSIVGQLNIPM